VATTSTATKTVVGVFNDFHEANSALQDLVSHGINRDDISLVANQHVSDQMQEAGYDPTVNIGTGAGVGAAIGGAGGLLLSLAGLAVPGIGPILAAGPLVAALGGAGVGAAVGSIVGALMNLGIPEDEAGHYAESVRRGDVLVAVKTNDMQADTVRDILDQRGAVDVEDRVANWKDRGYNQFDQNAAPYTTDDYRQERANYNTGTGMGTSVMGDRTIDRTPGNTLDRVGDRMADGAATTVDRVDSSARNIGSDVAQGTRNTGYEVKEGARELGYKAEDTARDAGRAVREGGREVKDTVEDAGRAVKRGAARVYHRMTD